MAEQANQSPVQFAGESADYRSARLELLEAEKQLRRQVSDVARLRSQLPSGHQVREDYAFDTMVDGSQQSVRLSELFTVPDRSLVLYSFMNDGDGPPCPMCNAFLDAFDGVARHVSGQLNVAIVAKASLADLQAWGRRRGWQSLRLLSSANNGYNRDYFAEGPDGSQLPMLNVFQKRGDAVTHSYTSELLFASTEPGQHARHMDMLFPLWNLFDLTPEGRPQNWMPTITDA